MNPNKALWEKGDFTRIAASMRDSGEGLVNRLGTDVGGTDLEDQLVLLAAAAEGFVSPMTWGIVDDVVERFVAAGVPEGRISCARDTFVFDSPVTPSEFLASFRTYHGPTMNAFEAAEASGRADELLRELDVLFNEQNQSPNKEATSIAATFLRVTVEL